MQLRSALFFWLAAIPLVSCSDEVQPSIGNLLRPSGLAYIPRSEDRADLFIADSEAQGVRVLQLRRTTNSRGELVNESVFLAGPNQFFPLIIPASGFPTRLAAAPDGARLYVLAPATEKLHLLDVSPVEFAESPSLSPSNVPIAVLDLAGSAGFSAVPVDLAMLSRSDSGSGSGPDLVAVAFDRIGEGDGALAVYMVEHVPGGARFVLDGTGTPLVVTASISEAPRDILVAPPDASDPDGTFRVFVASASQASVVSLIEIAVGGSGVPEVVSSRQLEAGGPTSALVDAGRAGILALRLDRSAAVLFERAGASYERSSQDFGSPFTPALERGSPDSFGRIDLRESPPVAGARGKASALLDPTNTVSLVEPGDLVGDAAEVVYIVHLDGRASFLIESGGVPSLRIAVTSKGQIDRITRTREDGLLVEGCPVVSAPLTCEDRATLGRGTDRSGCELGSILADFSVSKTLRATFRGPLASGRLRGSLTLPARPATTSSTSSMSPGIRYVITDPSYDFAAQRVEPGDLALVQIKTQPTSSTTCEVSRPDEVSIIATGTVTSVLTTSVEIEFERDADLPAQVSCGPSPIPLLSYEVYPAAREFVVAEARTDGMPGVGGVYARTRTSTSPVGESASLGPPVPLTLSTQDLFSCDPPTPRGVVLCRASAECASRICVASEISPCPGQCPSEEVMRVCSGVEIDVHPTPALSLSLLIKDSFRPTLPEEVVSVPFRQSWFTSYPGSRALTETVVGEDGSIGVAHLR